jgi:hypothetical protein
MTTIKQLSLTFSGEVLDLTIKLEGREIGLYSDENNQWSRILDNFEITGNLAVFMLCKGVNGTAWSMQIMIDNNQPHQYSGVIEDGYSRLTDSIKINQ